MSRYLLVVHDDSAAATIDDWLVLRDSPASEQWSTRLNGTFTLRIISPDVAAAVRGRTFFTGTALSETSAFVALDAAGWQRSERARSRDGVSPSGAFVQATWTRNELRITNDLLGTLPVMQAHGPGFVAFSDSLLVLADLRDRFGLVNTPNAEALLARTGLSWRTAQAASPETLVREVTMVAPGRGVTVQASRPLLVDADETTLATVLDQADDPVRAARRSAGFLVSLLRDLPRVQPTAVHLGSARDVLLLDALQRAGSVDSVPVRAEQTFAGSRSTDTLPEPSDGAALQGWAVSGLGLYDVVAASSPETGADAGALSVDAAGNTVARRIWGTETVEGMRAESGLDGPAADAYVAQVTKAIRSIGGDPDATTASQQHYVAFRSPRYVAGVRTGRVGLHPLHTASAAAVSTISDRVDGADGLDALETLLRPGPADTTDAADAARSAMLATELGGPLQDAEVPTLEVLGSAQDRPASTRLAVAVAAARGLDGSVADRAVLLELMEDLLGVLPEDLLPAFEPLLGNARWHLLEKRETLATAGPSSGTLLSLVLFAN